MEIRQNILPSPDDHRRSLRTSHVSTSCRRSGAVLAMEGGGADASDLRRTFLSNVRRYWVGLGPEGYWKNADSSPA